MLNRWNAAIEKRMAFVTPACLIFGVLFPEIAGKGLPLVPVVFAVMTFIGALKSGFRDVGRVFQNPLPLLLAVLFLHVIMPAAAWGAGHLFFSDHPDLITGIVLEFTVPAAVVGVMWVSIYQGNQSMALSLVVLDTVLAPFVIPVTLHVLVGTKVEMDPVEMMQELVFMIALPAVAAMCLNQLSGGRIRESWPPRLAFFSKLCLIFVVTANSSKVAPYIRHLTGERVAAALCILILAASGYLLGYGAAAVLGMDRENKVSVMYGAGMRNISAGAVIAAEYFPGEVLFPVMIGTLFQQVLAATLGTLLFSKGRESGRKNGTAAGRQKGVVRHES